MEKATRTYVTVQLSSKGRNGRFQVLELNRDIIHGKCVNFGDVLAAFDPPEYAENTHVDFIRKVISTRTETYFPEPARDASLSSQEHADRDWDSKTGQYFYSAR